ncbi:site-specific integrase [Halostagnicola sp. A-GB9-2]|uniref:site-specific integrase n=1 Tax=Halostagnicola sp. A-GB9-2 TaxID=3048066 RepID=UPI0024BF6908|nr:site-specific integrase [Halostagnicola sp. A-GB9-2]MDJ1431153.1 site-specific integrase [Halostagnicola sp. A-GB9-2]
MQIKTLKNQLRLIPNEHEYREHLVDAADSFRTEIMLRVAGEVGLRVGEIANAQPRHILAADDPSLDAHFLAVPEGKDTTGELENGKYREAYLPSDVERLLTRFIRTNSIGQTEPIVGVGKRRIQQIYEDIGEVVADKTGRREWVRLSPHDLRAYYAHTCLVRKGMNPEVVMSAGGWEDYESIKPYLGGADQETTTEAFEEAGLS